MKKRVEGRWGEKECGKRESVRKGKRREVKKGKDKGANREGNKPERRKERERERIGKNGTVRESREEK